MKGVLYGVDSFYWSMLLISITQAVPVSRNERDISEVTLPRLPDSQVCLYGGEKFLEGQIRPSTNPCETCTCFPPQFACSLRTCEVKPGCKALQSAGKCCPDYVCDCQKNGRTYGNGEKVEEPNPCNVCYCRGGEIKCAGVSCYTRSDCEPHYVPGKCCPKYDHCPAIDIKDKPIVPSTEMVEPTTSGPAPKDDSSAEVLQYTKAKPEPASSELKPGQVGTLEIIEIYPSQPQNNDPPIDKKEEVFTDPPHPVLTLKHSDTGDVAETEAETTTEEIKSDGATTEMPSQDNLSTDPTSVAETTTEMNFKVTTEPLYIREKSTTETISETLTTEEISKSSVSEKSAENSIIGNLKTQNVSDSTIDSAKTTEDYTVITEYVSVTDEILPEIEVTEIDNLSDSENSTRVEDNGKSDYLYTTSFHSITDEVNSTENSTDTVVDRIDENVEELDSVPEESNAKIYHTEKNSDPYSTVTEQYSLSTDASFSNYSLIFDGYSSEISKDTKETSTSGHFATEVGNDTDLFTDDIIESSTKIFEDSEEGSPTETDIVGTLVTINPMDSSFGAIETVGNDSISEEFSETSVPNTTEYSNILEPNSSTLRQETTTVKPKTYSDEFFENSTEVVPEWESANETENYESSESLILSEPRDECNTSKSMTESCKEFDKGTLSSETSSNSTEVETEINSEAYFLIQGVTSTEITEKAAGKLNANFKSDESSLTTSETPATTEIIAVLTTTEGVTTTKSEISMENFKIDKQTSTQVPITTIEITTTSNEQETSNSTSSETLTTESITPSSENSSQLEYSTTSSTIRKIDNSTATLAEILLKWLQSKKVKLDAKTNKTMESPRQVQNESEDKKVETPVSVLSALANELLKIVGEKEPSNENSTRIDEGRSLDFINSKPTDTSLEVYSSDIASLAQVLKKDGIVEIPNPAISEEIDTPIHLKYPFTDESLSPVLSMISDQLQFLRVGEEQPLYVNVPQDENHNNHRHGVVITPTSAPQTVNMVKVVDGVSIANQDSS